MKPSHCGQIARELSLHPKTRLERFRSLSHDAQADTLLCLSKRVLKNLAEELKTEELANTLEHLDPDQATDIIQLFPKPKQIKLIEKLNSRIRDQVTFLTEFDPQTAAGLMSLDYIQADEESSLADVAKQVDVHEKKTGRLPVILVMRNGKLIGQLPGHAFGLFKPTDKITPAVRQIHSVRHTASKQDIVDTLKRGRYNKVVVVDADGDTLGIIYADSILHYLEEKTSLSLSQFAGVHKEESVLDPSGTIVRFRYKWLILNLGTALIAASVVGLFQDTISKYVVLAVYMPIVAGMGGNAGTQTLAVLVRGITLGQVDIKTALPTLQREVLAGLLNGLIIGFIVFCAALILGQNHLIAIILGLAMIVNLSVSAAFGTIVPLLMKRLGKDPATSATIFITAATDTLGFLCFLGLATLLLP